MKREPRGRNWGFTRPRTPSASYFPPKLGCILSEWKAPTSQGLGGGSAVGGETVKRGAGTLAPQANFRNGSPLLSSGTGAAGVFPQLGPLIKRKDLRFQPRSGQSGRLGHGTTTPRPWSSERSQFAEGYLGLPPQDAACGRQPPTAGRTPTPASGPQDRRHPPPGGSGHPAPASPFLFLRRGVLP